MLEEKWKWKFIKALRYTGFSKAQVGKLAKEFSVKLKEKVGK